MRIKRLRVEEGFFDGIDITFDQGLNVLIGGRGVGKTSVIELLRFGLGVQGLTDKSDEAALTHALAVLQSGQVTIDLDVNGEDVSVTRAADSEAPRSAIDFPRPIVFSQTEIESVGLDSRGRLKLIDSFLPNRPSFGDEISAANSSIKSKSAAIVTLRREIEELNEKSSSLEKLRETEAELLDKQKSLASEDNAIRESQEELNALQVQLNSLAVDQENVTQFRAALSERRRQIGQLVSMPPAPKVADDAVRSLLKDLNEDIESDRRMLDTIVQRAEQHSATLDKVLSRIAEKRIPVEEKARTLRGRIEKFREGAGQVSRDLGKAQEAIARSENFQDMAKKRAEKLDTLISDCNADLERVATLRKQIFDQRRTTAQSLNDKLADVIRIDIQHLARLDDYVQALRDTLRGSGLRYNEIASIIAAEVGPQELMLFVHEDGYEDFSAVLDIPTDRAARLLGYLKDSDLGRILTASIEDDVQLMLLDGASYKQIDELSIGQRCTVALSLVLENQNHVLLVDQPEDHLDNEFVAETLIRALRQRSTSAQTILSSHNANIPVLGDASRVVHLDSNGRKGFVRSSNKLDAPEIVDAIETIMEGGKEAFENRAKFYAFAGSE